MTALVVAYIAVCMRVLGCMQIFIFHNATPTRYTSEKTQIHTISKKCQNRLKHLKRVIMRSERPNLLNWNNVNSNQQIPTVT